MSARVISVANIKGGVSKTTTGIFLATALAQSKGKKVLFLDCDSQASAYSYRSYEKSMDFYENIPEPYRIRKTDPTFIFETIEDNRATHDIIFVDLPRLTKDEDDQKIAMMLALCDSVLIPITSGELDNMSTIDFVTIVKRIEQRRKDKNRSYQIAGFASMTGRIPTEDKATREFMETLDIPILKSPLKSLKKFARPYTYDSLLDVGASERKEFESFFNEVSSFFNF